MFGIHHYVRLTPCGAQLQTYERVSSPTVFPYPFCPLPPPDSSTRTPICNPAHPRAAPLLVAGRARGPASTWSEPRRRRPSVRAGVRVERATPPPVERPRRWRRERTRPLHLRRLHPRRPQPRATAPFAAPSPVLPLRGFSRGGRCFLALSEPRRRRRSARAGVRIERATPPPAERPGGLGDRRHERPRCWWLRPSSPRCALP